ncbi:hypothetical protein Kisp01_33670 [Kineosporia sp. NBRC 101677]|uniref:hypothetical protein n=1 Tax=Kineosporia sp. NBRC 101677 TaxID=3032197 RepID=UPI0024A42265|nr:hypothetical protein [Kineosporia sp. NBRC 101677]GLY16352.1 hypothetical protein Kisp01_33670 [Kineosporia sp. NBRC 101677]
MRKNKPAVSVPVAALGLALTAAVIGTAGPANADVSSRTTDVSSAARASHFQQARAYWKAGAEGPNATRYDAFNAARKELAAAKGDRYWHEEDNLVALTKIPGTQVTPKQRAAVVRLTRELNGFFHTPGLYSIKPGNPLKIARADWIKSQQVASAEQKVWIAGAIDELHSYKKRYAKQRNLLSELLEIPNTGTTAEERAIARRNSRALNDFFEVSA